MRHTKQKHLLLFFSAIRIILNKPTFFLFFFPIDPYIVDHMLFDEFSRYMEILVLPSLNFFMVLL